MKYMFKDLFRTIKHSFGRFFAIASIIGLGVGFFAGLGMTCDDMKITSSQYYNNTNLMDVRVVSTLGLSNENINAFKNLDCVKGVMPAYQTDVLVNDDGNQNVVRLHSLNKESYTAQNIDNYKIISNNEDFINRPFLIEGNWPKNSDECVISKKSTGIDQQKIGDEIVITECSSELDKTLKIKKLKIVGYVKSSYYVLTSRLGSSTLGRGSVEQYAYVPESTFNDGLPYTEANLTIKGASNYYYNSQEYQNIIDNAMKQIKDVAPEQSQIRTSEIKSSALNKINDGQNELNSKRIDAENELNNNEAKLNSSKQQLINGKQKLLDGQKELETGYTQYQQQYDTTFAQINQAKQSINNAKTDFANIQTKIKENFSNISSNYTLVCQNVDGALTGLPKIINELNTSIKLMNQAKSLSSKYITDQELIKKLEEIFKIVESMIGNCISISQSFYNELSAASPSDQKVVYDKYKGDFMATFALFPMLEGIMQELFNEVNNQINAAWAEIVKQEAQATEKFNQAKAKLDEAAYELNIAKKQYEAGNNEYLAGLEKFNAAKDEALKQLNDAQAQIDNSKSQLDSIEKAEFLIMDRSKNTGCISLINDADRIANIAKVFPFIFFLVAALVALTSMTRMVEEERILIGTNKALGVSSARITAKYILYVLMSGISGSIVGLIVIPQVIPIVVIIAYTVIYDYPFPYIMPFDWTFALMSTAVGIGIALIATIAASVTSLKQVPATLMLPKAPKSGKKILLEHIKPLWSMLNFNWKIAFRNMFLYKKRLIMTIVGIAGCTALLLTGFGLSDSINDIINKQYSEISFDNFVANFDKDIDTNLKNQVDNTLKDNNIDPNTVAYIAEKNMVAQPEGKPDQAVIVDAPENIESFTKLRDLHDRQTKVKVPLTDDGVVISEKLANLMHVKAGDNIKIYNQDKIGNAGVNSYEFKVAGICENYVAHYIYMTQKTYEASFNKTFAPNTIILKHDADANAKQKFSNALYSINDVRTASYTDKAKESYRKMLNSVDMVVVVLIVFAAILAFVVLFNLTNINICERIREIATLKVLGSNRREMAMYIHRETLLLSIIGALVGIGLGFLMESFVIQSAEIDFVMFGRNIYAPSIIYSILITMAFTVIVIALTMNKIHNISMVESLKSIE